MKIKININPIVNMYYILTIMFVIIYYYQIPHVVSEELLKNGIIIINILILLDVIILIYKDKCNIKKYGLFRGIYVFILGLYIVHLQQSLDFLVFGSKFSAEEYYSHINTVILKSLCLSLIGLSCTIWGYLTFIIAIPPDHHKIRYSKLSMILSRMLVVIFLILFLYFGQGYLFMFAYGSVDVLGTAFSYIQLILELLIYSCLILTIIKTQEERRKRSFYGFFKSVGIIVNVSIIIFIIAILTSGDRGPAIYMVIAYMFSAQVANRSKITLRTAMYIGMVGALLITTWGIIRRENSSVEDIYTILYGGGEHRSVSPLTAELAGSSRALHYAVLTVPDKINYQYGTFQSAYILHSIPFTSYFDEYLFRGHKFVQSTSMITWIEQGDNPWSGVGTSCIADIYIDYGLWGVLGLMLIWGGLLRLSDRILETDIKRLSPFFIALVFTISVLAIYIPRSAILFHLKNVLWLWVILKTILFFGKVKLNLRSIMR